MHALLYFVISTGRYSLHPPIYDRRSDAVRSPRRVWHPRDPLRLPSPVERSRLAPPWRELRCISQPMTKNTNEKTNQWRARVDAQRARVHWMDTLIESHSHWLEPGKSVANHTSDPRAGDTTGSRRRSWGALDQHGGICGAHRVHSQLRCSRQGVLSSCALHVSCFTCRAGSLSVRPARAGGD